jgi:hypothetical protein
MVIGGWAAEWTSARYRPPGAREIAGVGGASMTGMMSAGGIAYGTGVPFHGVDRGMGGAVRIAALPLLLAGHCVARHLG